MILELDAGNSRIKWRLVDTAGGSRQTMAADAVFALNKMDSVVSVLEKQFDSLPMDKVTRVLAANVRGELFSKSLAAFFRQNWQLKTEFARVEKSCGGVTHAYMEETLGVDRWLAMLAAWREAGAACCVVDCGSTLTIDLIDNEGRHQGGYIVPGLHMMRDSLSGRSRALFIESVPDWDGIDPGTTTRQAIEHGILAALTGLLRQIYHNAGSHCGWILTGGDAALLSPFIPGEHRVIPELVLDGLAISMRQ